MAPGLIATVFGVIMPRCACAAKHTVVTLCVCVCVCVSLACQTLYYDKFYLRGGGRGSPNSKILVAILKNIAVTEAQRTSWLYTEQ